MNDLTAKRFTSSASSVSGLYSRRATIKKRGKKPGKSAMVVAVDSYLESPSGGTASDLYRAARKLSAHKPHCALQLLDTLAEHLLAAVAPNKAAGVQDEAST
ncbi:hypothetical protein GN244_ATG09650 [Phytophthora infestans]|uniref:Uncharacterized protein n=1 Tax=Phytophthora infestans TaxID=4787 RepID=A0A833STY1_PHYIN|nr:hypothetical protein GN244_ATG09650 [Phytophthora infestans]KAF4127926.1 hypothetical protein GN958_ATG22754 [Phytophthora infestans]